jgi:formamidopyrimidine-DNA glycosylase
VVFDDDGAEPSSGTELRFVDQRTFGGLSLHPLVPAAGGGLVPAPIAHIGRDPMDPAFSLDGAVAAIRRRRTELKRALLDQTVVSGIGNIYADEALWRVRLHGARPTETLTRAQGRAVLTAAAEVMDEALAQGGTSFDALYVNVNGASGYFDRSLAVYGQADRPCPRCGTPIRREPFMNRSSYSCPRCQPRPRRRPPVTASRCV